MVDFTQFPTLADATRMGFGPAISPEDYARARRPEPPRPSLIGGGLRAGANVAHAMLAGAVAAGGRAVGADDFATRAEGEMLRNLAEAEQFGRPDLETPPWREDGAPLVPWLTYQAAKQVPQWLPTIAAGAVTGGAGGVALGGALAGAQGVGAMYEQARENDGVATAGEAQRALLMGIPYGAAEALVPFGLGKAARGATRPLASKVAAPKTAKGRVAMGLGGAAVAEGVTEGVQTAMELSFRDDMTSAEKSRQIVDAVITGGLLGGTISAPFLAVGEMRQVQSTPAGDVSDDQLRAAVDAAVAGTQQAEQEGAPEALRLTPPPEGDAPAQRPLADVPTPQLVQHLAETEQAAAAEDTPQLARARAVMRAELARRDEGAQPQDPQADVDQGELFRNLPLQPTGAALDQQIEADEARAQEVERVRGVARQLAGGTTKFIDSLDAANDLELAVAVHDQLVNEESTRKDGFTARTAQLAQELGVIDSQGRSVLEREQDLQADLDQAQRRTNTAIQRFKATNGRKQEAAQLEQARRDLTRAEARVEMASRLRDYLTAREQGKLADAPGARLKPAVTKVAGEKPADQSYDITLPDGSVTNVRYDRTGRSSNHGWRFADGTPVALKPGEKGISRVTDAVVRQAQQGGVPQTAKTGALINDPDAPGNRYRRGTAPDPGTVDAEALQADADKLQVGSGRVSVIRSLADAPPEVAAQVRADKAEDAAGITTPDGEVYLIADNLSSREEGIATLFHETLGHRGLQNRFRKRLDQELRTMYRSNPRLKQEADAWLRAHPDAYAENQTERAVEEVLAERSEAGRMDATFFARLAHVVKQFARRFWSVEMSDAEVDVALAMAHRAALKAPATGASGGRYARAGRASAQQVPPTLTATTAAVKTLSTQADKLLAKAKKAMGSLEMRPMLRQTALYWTTAHHHAETYDRYFDGELKKLEAVRQRRTTVTNLLEQQSLMPAEALRTLERTAKKSYDRVVELMGMTFYRIDPTRRWDEHTWLHEHKDVDKLKAHHRRATTAYKALVQSKHAKVYHDFVNTNKAMYLAQYTMMLRAQLKAYMQDGLTRPDPMKVYQLSAAYHRNPEATRKFWKAEFDAVVDIARKFTDRTATESREAKPGEAGSLAERADTIAELVDKFVTNIGTIDQAPYFHLGRHGEYFVTFEIPVTRDDAGRASYDAAVLDAVQKRLLAEGFDGIELPDVVMGHKPKPFIRVATEADAERLRAIVSEVTGVAEAAAGQRGVSGISPVTDMTRWADLAKRKMDRHEADAIRRARDEAEAEAIKTHYTKTREQLDDLTLNLMPNISSARVMAHRDSVSGFDKNHLQSYAYRARVASHALANLATADQIQEHFSAMDRKIVDAQRGGGRDAFVMADVLREQERREAQRATQPDRNWVDAVRAYNHAYFLGMSPAYLLTNLTQVPVLLLPELGKKHGYVKSAKAIGDVTGTAFTIVNAAFKGAGTGRGVFQSFEDPIITPEVLAEAGIPLKTAERVMRMVNTGMIDIGSAARDMGRIEENRADRPQDRMLRYAGAFGLYSEMTTRLIAGLAAYELSDQSGRHQMTGPQQEDYVAHVVHESMMNYTTDNTARAAGRQGFIGKASPLPLAFMQYSMQLLEKLAREGYRWAGGDSADPQQRAEARRFILGHLTVVGMLAGSLGLPGASVVATVLSKAVEWTDGEDEHYDAVAAYRNFLSDVFGEELGEVLARGVPRAVNIDMSVRAGEQDVIPFSRFLTDKREIRERVQDLTTRFGGSPLSMGMNIAEGLTLMAKGDVMEGLKKAVPVALKGPVEASRMSARGYLDKNGNELPMDAEAHDIFVQFFGFSPSEKAEYTEANFAQTVRDARLRRQAQGIRRNILRAIEGGDREAALDWMRRARRFDESNPAYDILPGISSLLVRRARARAEAGVAGLPLRGNLRDPASVDLTRFANF